MSNEVAGLEVGLLVAFEELFENLHRGIDGLVGLGVTLLHGERIARDLHDSLEGLQVSVRPLLIDDEFGANDVWAGVSALVEPLDDVIEFGSDVLLNAFARRLVADLNSGSHSTIGKKVGAAGFCPLAEEQRREG